MMTAELEKKQETAEKPIATILTAEGEDAVQCFYPSKDADDGYARVEVLQPQRIAEPFTVKMGSLRFFADGALSDMDDLSQLAPLHLIGKTPGQDLIISFADFHTRGDNFPLYVSVAQHPHNDPCVVSKRSVRSFFNRILSTEV